MLASFRVRNFKSFRGEAFLNLNANRADKTNLGAVLRPEDAADKGVQLLAGVAIYGANASGKTNFILALDYLSTAVAYSQSSWKPGSGTMLYPNVLDADQPSEMEAVVVINGVRYRYGFLGTRKVFLKEWLYSYPHGRERELFIRTTNDDASDPEVTAQYGRTLTGSVREFNSSLRRTRPDSLLLSSMAQDNQSESLALYEYFRGTNRVFDRSHEESDTNFASNFTFSMPGFRELLLGMIQTADNSVEDFDIQEIDNPEPINEESEKNEDTPRKWNVRFSSKINDKIISLPMYVQSRGVKQIYAMSAHVCMSLLEGTLLIIDEIDTSMHPHLVAKVVSIFQNPSSNPNGAQIVFTTHDTHLIGIQHLRRDQVWFVEKNGGLSELYSLSEFSPRKEENIEAGYLRGNYGAVPTGGLSLKLLGLSKDEINNTILVKSHDVEVNIDG